jgi:hypothetical protein
MISLLLSVIVVQVAVIYNQQKRIAYLLDTVRRFRYIEDT